MTVLPYPGQSLMEPQCINGICVAQFTNQYSAVITLRVDRRAIPMRQTMKELADWWCSACGMTPAYVPAAAKDPLYSTWYSYAQNISEKTG